MKDFDCIVIGAGMGGLTAAGRLASSGVKVLLIDKNKTPGGYLQSFRRRGFVFDSSVDCFGGMGEGGPIGLLLKGLGVEDEVERIKVDPIRTSIFPGMTVRVPGDSELYVEELLRLFPAEKDGVRELFQVMGAVYDDVERWGEFVTGLGETDPIPTNIIKYGGATFGDLLDRFIKDPRLLAVLSDRCPFYGLPPSRVSAVAMTALVMSYFRAGAWRVRGGSQRLAEAIVRGIESKGGTVLMRSEMESIVIEKGARNEIADGLAVAVTTTGGDEYTARAVVSAIDFSRTVASLKGLSSEVEKKLSHQSRPDLSSSFFIIYAGGRYDLDHLGGSSSVGYFPTFDMESNFGPRAPFNVETSFGVTIPTMDDPSMLPVGAEQGTHALSAHEMVEYSYTDRWKERKEELTERFLKKVALVVPDIRESSLHIEAATPATLERYTANSSGAAYGWAQAPGMARPIKVPKTFVKNLFTAGHWSPAGGGVMAAAYSGFKAARDVEKSLA